MALLQRLSEAPAQGIEQGSGGKALAGHNMPVRGSPSTVIHRSFPFIGQLGLPTHVELVNWTPTLPVSAGSVATTALLDTGSPAVLVDEQTVGLPPGPGTLTLTAFGGTLYNVPVVAFSLVDVGFAAAPRVLLGGTLFSRFSLTLDYKGSNAYLAAGGQPTIPPDIAGSGLGAPVVLPFELRGGGLAQLPGCGLGCLLPPTRVTVPVVVEGRQPVAMIVDTGASWVVLDTAFASSLSASGRPRLDGITLAGSGSEKAYLTRLASISVGTSADVSEPVLVLPPGDLTLASLSAETGVTVVGLIGGGFLRRRVTVVDYAARRLLLAPYVDNSHIDAAEFVRVGFTLLSQGDSWIVGDVYAGTSADRVGLVPGDFVTRINGASLLGLDPGRVRALLDDHHLGDLLIVTVARGSSSVDLEVAVENLLPEFTGP